MVIYLLLSKQRVKREWCSFVLTPDFIHVMGGEVYSYIDIFANIRRVFVLCYCRQVLPSSNSKISAVEHSCR